MPTSVPLAARWGDVEWLTVALQRAEQLPLRARLGVYREHDMHRMTRAVLAVLLLSLSACGLERLETMDEVRHDLGEPCRTEGASSDAPPEAGEEFWLYCVYDGRPAGATETRWLLRPECPADCENFLRVRFQYGRCVEMRDPDGKSVGPSVRRFPDGAPVFGP